MSVPRELMLCWNDDVTGKGFPFFVLPLSSHPILLYLASVRDEMMMVAAAVMLRALYLSAFSYVLVCGAL